jgi:hypothetical protein
MRAPLNSIEIIELFRTKSLLPMFLPMLDPARNVKKPTQEPMTSAQANARQTPAIR